MTWILLILIPILIVWDVQEEGVQYFAKHHEVIVSRLANDGLKCGCRRGEERALQESWLVIESSSGSMMGVRKICPRYTILQ